MRVFKIQIVRWALSRRPPSGAGRRAPAARACVRRARGPWILLRAWHGWRGLSAARQRAGPASPLFAPAQAPRARDAVLLGSRPWSPRAARPAQVSARWLERLLATKRCGGAGRFGSVRLATDCLPDGGLAAQARPRARRHRSARSNARRS